MGTTTTLDEAIAASAPRLKVDKLLADLAAADRTDERDRLVAMLDDPDEWDDSELGIIMTRMLGSRVAKDSVSRWRSVRNG